ncbi:MAG: exosortase/archaeosortase family protein [Opitutae bacterium]|nr:exosortase/archaeosortase family protein [Opitutae bacterium]
MTNDKVANPSDGSETIASLRNIFGSISLLIPWSLLLFQLSITWETNEQYAHGYLAPILCLYLLLKTKIPEPLEKETNKPKSAFEGKAYLLLGIPMILTLFPLWLVRGANSDWRMLNLALFSVVFLLTIAQWYDHGGWPRIKVMLFPLLFFLVAIPWPLATDLQLTQWFQEKISSLIVDILLLLEHEARLEGTVIDIGVFGQIGVDQACSGIHGLQASLVITLFLGAYYKLRPLNRAIYVLAGIGIALLLNLARAFSLSFFKIKGKGEWLEEPLFTIAGWEASNLHDLAGWIETGIIFILILLLGRMATFGYFSRALGNQLASWSNLQSSPPLPFSILSILMVTGTACFTEFHYRNTESQMKDLPTLRLALEGPGIHIEEQSISRQVAAQLHYEDAQSVQWQDRVRLRLSPFGFVLNPESEYWQAFECTWDSGGACTAVLSTHTPESCLPLTGLVQINPTRGSPPIMTPVRIGDQDILFEMYEFARGSRKLFVFRCFWPSKLLPGKTNAFPTGGYDFKGRINAALEGRRNVGGTMLAIAVANVSSQSVAIEKLVSHARDKIKLKY